MVHLSTKGRGLENLSVFSVCWFAVWFGGTWGFTSDPHQGKRSTAELHPSPGSLPLKRMFVIGWLVSEQNASSVPLFRFSETATSLC